MGGGKGNLPLASVGSQTALGARIEKERVAPRGGGGLCVRASLPLCVGYMFELTGTVPVNNSVH